MKRESLTVWFYKQDYNILSKYKHNNTCSLEPLIVHRRLLSTNDNKHSDVNVVDMVSTANAY